MSEEERVVESTPPVWSDDEAVNRQSQTMFEKSGQGNTTDPLALVLYVLMRDHIVPGDLENILLFKTVTEPITDGVNVCNGWLLAYAEDMAGRIRAMKGV